MLANKGFQFKQFFIEHDRCAMKVGTDSIVLGSWLQQHNLLAALSNETKLKALDIGCGSGLLAIMLAQTLAAQIQAQVPYNHAIPTFDVLAIEPETEAAKQALENMRASPWQHNLRLQAASLQDFCNQDVAEFAHGAHQTDLYSRAAAGRFDIIVANPPYFPIKDQQSMLAEGRSKEFTGHLNCVASKDATPRVLARQQTQLRLPLLCYYVAQLLQSNGTFYCVLPESQLAFVQQCLARNDLAICRQLLIRTTPNKPPSRVCLAIVRAKLMSQFNELDEQNITIQAEDGTYSEEFKQLCRNFYLNF